MLKQNEITNIEIPKYGELSVQKIWPLVKEAQDLFEYFPNYTNKQIPNCHFMFSILWTLRFSTIKGIVSDARRSRSLHENDNKDQFVYIERKLLKEISDVFAQKSKFDTIKFKATKGKTPYILKKSSKLIRKYKPRKKYLIDNSKFAEREEEKEKNDEDHMD